MEDSKKNKKTIKSQTQKEIDRLIEEIDETNFFAAIVSRSKKLFKKNFIEGLLYGIGGAITAFAIKKLFPNAPKAQST